MRANYKYPISAAAIMILLASCNVLEKVSTHGLNSGYYKYKPKNQEGANVYLDVSDEKIDVYHQTKKQPDKSPFITVPITRTDSAEREALVFNKQSLDVDITTILLKYRPSVYGLPAQMNTDFNMALYAGWRHDAYYIKSRKDPLGKQYQKISNRGYDLGFFGGTGSTLISPFTTRNKRTDEYNGMIIQAGIAGFIESSMASFGFAVGYDHLLNADRSIWIYNNKPWIGFIVGIALN